MTGHIGIVACSAPGAALCYETICAEAAARMGGHAHPEISMHAFNFAEHVRYVESGDWKGVGRLLLASVRKLAAIGAELAVCPDNTVHQALDDVLPESPIPWLHIVDPVIAAARAAGATRLAVLGTRYLMEGPVYADRLRRAGIEWRVPGADERERVNRVIFDELVYSRVSAAARAAVCGIIERLRKTEGCDAVVLGCTELPLLVTPECSPLPTLDSTRLLARAAVARVVAGALRKENGA